MKRTKLFGLVLMGWLVFGLVFAQDTQFFQLARSGSGTQILGAISSGANVDARDEFGQTPLMYAVEHNTSEAVTVLIGAGANVNARTNAQWTPIMYAARNPDSAITALLLEAGADATATADDGTTALIISTQYGHGQVVELLENARPEPAVIFEPGDLLIITDGPLRVRAQPNLQAETRATLNNGSTGRVSREPATLNSGFWWVHANFDAGIAGWVAQGPREAPYVALYTLPEQAATAYPPEYWAWLRTQDVPIFNGPVRSATSTSGTTIDEWTYAPSGLPVSHRTTSLTPITGTDNLLVTQHEWTFSTTFFPVTKSTTMHWLTPTTGDLERIGDSAEPSLSFQYELTPKGIQASAFTPGPDTPDALPGDGLLLEYRHTIDLAQYIITEHSTTTNTSNGASSYLVTFTQFDSSWTDSAYATAVNGRADEVIVVGIRHSNGLHAEGGDLLAQYTYTMASYDEYRNPTRVIRTPVQGEGRSTIQWDYEYY